ncbi:E3 ubiquitin ligase PQT3-like isoform X1 [Senna tora]|uniref:E3 ubiquitin ligase PQT3-like isoform X1 n=1 Tax=Senna tora TaxID=362788 RepID=A0A834WS17_9FABA|nr:E3 ubiquitin ligase PQT3-like isoform X1 [Senna tora]
MAVYYKFKSARDYESISINGPFISVGKLKEKIVVSKRLGSGTDFDLLVTHAKSNEEYLDEATLIPKYTSVIVCRVPGLPLAPIVVEQQRKVEDEVAVNISVTKCPEESDWEDFGGDLYATSDLLPVQSSNLVTEAPSTNKDDENSKVKALIDDTPKAASINKDDENRMIKAIIDTPALDWRSQVSDGFGPGRGFGRDAGRPMVTGQGFGFQRNTPPQGYVCHRCNVPGHFIKHCPTNGDSNYDIKKVKPPTGIPRSMLMPNPVGSYALSNGVVAVVKPNEAAFEKEMEGLSSNHFSNSSSNIPSEFLCPLCNDVMKDAALTKCCFTSFCDKCIRGCIISKSICVCGAKGILADDLIPNKTLRETISRMVEQVNTSSENAGSTFHVSDMDAASCAHPKAPSSTSSSASKGEQKVSPANKETKKRKIEVAATDSKVVSVPPQKSEILMATRDVDMSEVTYDSMIVKERAPQGSAQQVEEKVPQKLATNEADNLWKTFQNPGIENYMMPMCPPSAYNSYWNSMQPVMPGFIPPYGAMQMMDYGLGPSNMTFGGVLPQYPFYNPPVVPPQRNFTEDQEFGRKVSSGRDFSSMKSEHNSIPSSTEYHSNRRKQSEWSSQTSSTIAEGGKLNKKRRLSNESSRLKGR